jgi:hypothetical protein
MNQSHGELFLQILDKEYPQLSSKIGLRRTAALMFKNGNWQHNIKGDDLTDADMKKLDDILQKVIKTNAS